MTPAEKPKKLATKIKAKLFKEQIFKKQLTKNITPYVITKDIIVLKKPTTPNLISCIKQPLNLLNIFPSLLYI